MAFRISRLTTVILLSCVTMFVATAAGLIGQQDTAHAVREVASLDMVSTASTGNRVAPTRVGINLPPVSPWGGQPIYANIAAHAQWMYSKGQGWSAIDTARLDDHGWVRALAPGEFAPLPLLAPSPPGATVRLRCTYVGQGALAAGGIFHETSRGDHFFDVTGTSDANPSNGGWLMLQSTNPQDPLRDLDCREKGIARDRLFDAEFLTYIRQFAVIRFLDWSNVNANDGGKWSRRNPPDAAYQGGAEGVAVEHMVQLANEADADGWFPMPYKADQTYIENYARYVHDHLKPGRIAYVELGNELWNLGFPAARQAMAEGQAEGLGGGNPNYAMLQRYAEKSRTALAIWTRVFADNPARLVRVVSTQNVNPETARQVLGFKDLATYVDALATAPYIQLDTNGYSVADVDRVFGQLNAEVDKAIDLAAQNKALAAHYGKRYIAYEGGQHLVPQNIELSRLIQRDPRMAAVYTRYLDGWRAKVGDLVTLFTATGTISPFGAWGLREYAGQPLEQTPKLRAVRAFLDER